MKGPPPARIDRCSLESIGASVQASFECQLALGKDSAWRSAHLRVQMSRRREPPRLRRIIERRLLNARFECAGSLRGLAELVTPHPPIGEAARICHMRMKALCARCFRSARARFAP